MGELQAQRISFVEAWTRDAEATCRWYEATGFRRVFSNMHVYVTDEESKGILASQLPGLRPMYTFAHYIGDDRAGMRGQFQRVYECQLFPRAIDS